MQEIPNSAAIVDHQRGDRRDTVPGMAPQFEGGFCLVNIFYVNFLIRHMILTDCEEGRTE